MDAQEQAPGLVRGEGLTAWRQIADALTADIAAGRYAPGQQLPTETALAARFSEIAAGAGREAWGDLLAAATVAAPPEQAAALALAAGAPVLELHTIHR